MRHSRYFIDRLRVSGRELAQVGGDLVVAEFEGREGLDWELVCRTKPGTVIDMAPHTLEMDGPKGPLSGPALLVRSDGTAHVFRGAGTLHGFPGFGP